MHEVITEEHGPRRPPGHRADAVGHAPLPHHLASQLGGTDQVVVGARGDDAEDEVLRDAPTHADHEAVFDVVLAVDVAVVDRELLGDAEGHPHREDGDLVHRVGVGEDGGGDRVTRLVVGDGLLLTIRESHRLAAGPHKHAVAGQLEVLLVDLVVAAPNREQGGLVDEVGEVGAGHPRRAASHDEEVDVGVHALGLRVHLEDQLPLADLGKRHHHLTIEAPRPQEGRVEDVGPVGGRDHHDALGGLEAVHLGEHLVERLLPLVMAAAEAGAALAADRVDLVHEDDGLAHLASALEQVAHAAGADAHEHLHEVRAGDGEEGHASLAGHRTGDERLAGARRAHQEDALGNPGADLGEAVRRLEEVDDLGDLLLHPVVASYVREGRPRPLRGVRLGLRAADRHDPAHLALSPALHEPEEGHEDADRDEEGQEAHEEVGGGGLVLDVHALFTQHLEVGIRDASVERAGGAELLAVLQLAGDGAVGVVDLDALDVALAHVGHEARIGDLAGVAGAAEQGAEHHDAEREAEEGPQPPLGHALAR